MPRCDECGLWSCVCDLPDAEARPKLMAHIKRLRKQLARYSPDLDENPLDQPEVQFHRTCEQIYRSAERMTPANVGHFRESIKSGIRWIQKNATVTRKDVEP